MRRVKSGEAFKFQADEWNAMAEVVERAQAHAMDMIAGRGNATRPAGRVLVLNSSDDTITEGVALVASGVATDPGDDGVSDPLHDLNYILGGYATEESQDGPFFVTREDIDPGDLGSALAYGVFAAKPIVLDEKDQYLRPSIADPGKLETCRDGYCRILCKWEVRGDAYCLAMLGLGGGSGASGRYSGMFAVSRTEPPEGGEENAVAVIVHNSDMPDSDMAGIAFVNNQPFQVGKQVFLPPSGMSYVYLKFVPPVRETPESDFIEGSAGLALEAELRESDDEAQWYLLGSLSLDEDGVLAISQDHRAGAVRMTWFGPCDFLRPRPVASP